MKRADLKRKKKRIQLSSFSPFFSVLTCLVNYFLLLLLLHFVFLSVHTWLSFFLFLFFLHSNKIYLSFSKWPQCNRVLPFTIFTPTYPFHHNHYNSPSLDFLISESNEQFYFYTANPDPEKLNANFNLQIISSENQWKVKLVDFGNHIKSKRRWKSVADLTQSDPICPILYICHIVFLFTSIMCFEVSLQLRINLVTLY